MAFLQFRSTNSSRSHCPFRRWSRFGGHPYPQTSEVRGWTAWTLSQDLSEARQPCSWWLTHDSPLWALDIRFIWFKNCSKHPKNLQKQHIWRYCKYGKSTEKVRNLIRLNTPLLRENTPLLRVTGSVRVRYGCDTYLIRRKYVFPESLENDPKNLKIH